MKEIVWVVGPSGVGKETLCRSITDNQNRELVKQLGWTEFRLGISDLSIALVPRGHDKEKKDDRDRITDELAAKQDVFDIVLLKWQALDSLKGRVKAIGAVFPDATTRALVLVADGEAIKQRHLEREDGWEPSEGWDNQLGRERDIIKEALGDFQGISYIDTNNGYDLTKVPTS